MNEYATSEHALKYLALADKIPHRVEGEAVLLEMVSRGVRRILDLGTGDGRLLSLLLIDRPHAEAVAVDFSPTMLEAARAKLVTIREFLSSITIWTIRCHRSENSMPSFQVSPSIIAAMRAKGRFTPKSTNCSRRLAYFIILSTSQPGRRNCMRVFSER